MGDPPLLFRGEQTDLSGGGRGAPTYDTKAGTTPQQQHTPPPPFPAQWDSRRLTAPMEPKPTLMTSFAPAERAACSAVRG